ncbi:MFS transporter [Mesorhizobium sp. NZP2077]|uniref:MFS transporter n=1 Tax=Mesorhizobium sp. NZP2077 TaxID=2483404 RepID=UPI00155319E3|nr:MFS transporter [Mesorhizobium sp. NZP2077]QKD17226.1 MFS transporter [Mesorhizobium sp. NZP2077]
MFVIVVLWVAFFIINFNIAMMIPLLPFIARDVGLSSSEAGRVLIAFPIVALISNLVLGPLIDRYGRKRFIVMGAVGCGAILLLTATVHGATSIALGRAATGLFMPMIGASIFAAIADYIPTQDRSRITGYVTTAAPVAFLFSISMGVVLGGLLTWRLPLLLLAVICLALAAMTSTLPPTRPEALSSDPISVRTYRERLWSLSLDAGTRLLLLSYFCWSAGMYVFLGLYPSWLVQHGLVGEGAGTIGTMLFLGETGGLLGAFLSGWLTGFVRHPLALCAAASLGIAIVVLAIPFGTGHPVIQALAYGIFAFGRDLMLALILGGAMLLIPASQRGSLNAMLNAVYQTGASIGGLASAWLYGFRTDFTANAFVSSAVFVASALMLWSITKINEPIRQTR